MRNIHTDTKHFQNQIGYLHARHIHDTPPHIGAVPHVAAQHIRDRNFREINIGDASIAGVVELLRETGIAATRNKNLRRCGLRESGELGNERVFELRPFGVPLESIAMAADGEETVPIFFAGEISESLEKIVDFPHGYRFRASFGSCLSMANGFTGEFVLLL